MTTLYRFFDDAGTLIYVGVTGNLERRLMKHGAQTEWWAEVARTESESFVSRELALEEENQIIRKLRPKYNKRGSGVRAVATYRLKVSLIEQFREAAAIENLSMTAALEALIEDYCERMGTRPKGGAAAA